MNHRHNLVAPDVNISIGTVSKITAKTRTDQTGWGKPRPTGGVVVLRDVTSHRHAHRRDWREHQDYSPHRRHDDTRHRSEERSDRRQRRSAYDRNEPWDRRYSQSSGEYSDSSTTTNSSSQAQALQKATGTGLLLEDELEFPSLTNTRNLVSVQNLATGWRELVYPHYSLGQIGGYIASSLEFNQLSYEQFIAGELRTISNTRSRTETRGRQRLLEQVGSWRLRANTSWPQVCSTYAASLHRIENGEMS